MAENLSREEVVELVLNGGLRGSTGKIEAQEGYYSYDSGSIIPFMSDQWQGVALSANLPYDTIYDVYGSSDTPYFLCQQGTAYTDQGDEIGGYSIAIEMTAYPDSEDPTILHEQYVWHWYIFSQDGVLLRHITQSQDVPDPMPYNDTIYITPLAGYNDNAGTWSFDYYIGFYQQNGQDVRMASFGSSFPAGNPLVDACGYWGAGQKPQQDDGVTPTGGTGGGGGTYSRPDETVSIPNLPSINIADLGMCSIYHVTTQQVADFSAYLWSMNGFFDDIIKNQSSPMENVISLSMIPTISFNEAGAEIIIGNTASGVQGYKLMTTFYEVDCGSINVTEYYNNFADYRTEIQIFLPFIGLRDIPVNDCMKGKIKVVYHVDVFTGQCLAFIQTYTGNAWHVTASYNGSIACQIPLSGANFMSVYNSVLSAVGSAVSGNALGVASSLMNVKPEYQRSGNIGSTAGLMGIRYPYLIFTTPQIFTPATFKQDNGYIANISGKLSSFSGYVQVDTSKLDLNGLVITEAERDLLYTLLDQGIYV